jgi:hypothetical protein
MNMKSTKQSGSAPHVLIIVGFLSVLLALTNPTLDDHKQKVKDLFGQYMDSENDNEESLGTLFGKTLGYAVVESAIRRKNYGLFSVGYIGKESSPALTFGIFGSVFPTEKLRSKLKEKSKDLIPNIEE